MNTFTEEDQQVLKNSPLLNQLSAAMFLHFLDISNKVTYATDENLLVEGQDSDNLFIIISGVVNLYKNDETGKKPELIGTLSSTQSIGEIRVIQNRTCTLTVKATEPTVVLQTSISELSTKKNQDCHEAILNAIGFILNERLISNNQVILNKIKDKQKRTRQLLYSLGLIAVLVIFLGELAVALHYALNPSSFCSAVKHHPTKNVKF